MIAAVSSGGVTRDLERFDVAGRDVSIEAATSTTDEHVLVPLMREGPAIMTGIFWDVGGA